MRRGCVCCADDRKIRRFFGIIMSEGVLCPRIFCALLLIMAEGTAVRCGLSDHVFMTESPYLPCPPAETEAVL